MPLGRNRLGNTSLYSIHPCCWGLPAGVLLLLGHCCCSPPATSSIATAVVFSGVRLRAGLCSAGAGVGTHRLSAHLGTMQDPVLALVELLGRVLDDVLHRVHCWKCCNRRLGWVVPAAEQEPVGAHDKLWGHRDRVRQPTDRQRQTERGSRQTNRDRQSEAADRQAWCGWQVVQ